MESADFWIDQLNLEAHPEGGYYKEVYRNPGNIQIMEEGGTRNLATSIYFLLKHKDKSHFHQLKSDELWYFHKGQPAVVHILEAGGYRREILGSDISKGHSLQVVIPRESIFAAEVLDSAGDDYTLMGCMVNPGFDFKDFRMVEAEELHTKFPEHQTLIEKFAIKG
ncbi:MAG: cupin domain-containing protein [Marinoscillum sp.]